MQNKELESYIREVVNLQKEFDSFWDKAEEMFNMDPESKFFERLTVPIDKAVTYIDSELAKYGATDSWMGYFVYENDCGERKFTVNIPTDNGYEKVYTLNSVDTFINFLELEYGV